MLVPVFSIGPGPPGGCGARGSFTLPTNPSTILLNVIAGSHCIYNTACGSFFNSEPGPV